MKKIIYLGLIGWLSIAAYDITSNSAPASSTGAPGEVNCTTSGCHDDNIVNSGGGTASLTIGNGITDYIPGTTYTVIVNVNQGALNRFGFQVFAMKNSDSSNVGNLKVIDAARTQTISGLGNNINKKYITYTYQGTIASTLGQSQWLFEWQAPATDVGPVTLYLAAIAANNDGMDLGDFCYLKSLQLTANPLGIKSNFSQKQEFKIFPNPVRDQIKIEFVIEKTSTIKFELYDLKGSKVQAWDAETKSAGKYTQSLDLSSDHPKGIYVFKFINDDKSFIKNISIN